MHIQDPEPELVEVHDYDFSFPNGKTFGASVWPHAGDSVGEVAGVSISFHFPRLSQIQTIYLGPGVTMLSTKGKREFLTDEDMQKRFKKALDVRKRAQQEAKEARGKAHKG